MEILGETTGTFDVEDMQREEAIRLRHEALERWTAIVSRPPAPNPMINDLASKIQELTRDKHRLLRSIHTQQALLFGSSVGPR